MSLESTKACLQYFEDSLRLPWLELPYMQTNLEAQFQVTFSDHRTPQVRMHQAALWLGTQLGTFRQITWGLPTAVQPQECSNWDKHISDVQDVTYFQELLKPLSTKLVRLKNSHRQIARECSVSLEVLTASSQKSEGIHHRLKINSFIVTGEAHYHSGQGNRSQVNLT